LPGVGTRGLFFDPDDPDADLTSDSDSSEEDTLVSGGVTIQAA